MMATIRTGASIFKGAIEQICKIKQTVTKITQHFSGYCINLAKRIKASWQNFYNTFWKKKKRQAPLILLNQKASPAPKGYSSRKQKKKKKAHKRKQKPNTSKPKVITLKAPKAQKQIKHLSQEILGEQEMSATDQQAMIESFYHEWEKNWGPALTSLDKKYLEQASFEEAMIIIANARLTLKSPYLKAVYNGLEDLKDISDLLEHDKFAKERIKPVLKLYWDKGPEVFVDRLFTLHDKGVFPTRSGERRLSLDPRLVPEWLGLA